MGEEDASIRKPKESLGGRMHRGQNGGPGHPMWKEHQREAEHQLFQMLLSDVRGGQRITVGHGDSALVTGTRTMPVEGVDREPDCRRLLREKKWSGGCWYRLPSKEFCCKESKVIGTATVRSGNRALCFVLFPEMGEVKHVFMLAEIVRW